MSTTSAPPAKVPEAQTLPSYSWRTLSPSAQLLYIHTENEANEAVSLLETDIVGFDLEWRPNYSKNQRENPVALVQIANNDYILLIQISKMRDFPKRLKEYLQNPDILKAGVGIQKDVTKLFRDHQVAMRGCVDLALMARSVDNDKWKGRYTNPIGLARLIQTYECLVMEKGKVQRSNWEKYLSPKQQDYAGSDAHAGFVIYTRLEDMKDQMAIAPRNEYYMFDCFRGVLCHPSGAPWAPQNPNYDPGPPPPPKVKKEKPSLDAQTDPNAQSGSTISPESPLQIGGSGEQPAVEADSLVQQRSISSTTLPISDDRNKGQLTSAGLENLSSEIIPNSSTVTQSSSQRQAGATPGHRRRRGRGNRPQQGETAITQRPSQRGRHRGWGGSAAG